MIDLMFNKLTITKLNQNKGLPWVCQTYRPIISILNKCNSAELDIIYICTYVCGNGSQHSKWPTAVLIKYRYQSYR